MLKEYFSPLREAMHELKQSPWKLAAFFLCCLISAFSFQHFDLFQTAPHGIMVLESMARGNFLSYFSYAENISGFCPAYHIVLYGLLAIWNLPVFCFHAFSGTVLPLPGIVCWNKLLLLGFGVLCANALLRCAKVSGMERKERTLLLTLFGTSPLLFWQLPMAGQYDIFALTFTVSALELFLRKKFWQFSLMIAFAACFKNFALLPGFLLILLAEKRILRLALHGALMAGPSFLLMLPFSADLTRCAGRGDFLTGFLLRFFQAGFPAGNGNAGLFFAALGVLALFAYAETAGNEEEFRRCACYLPLAGFSLTFLFVDWHPQWLILIVPFALLSLFLSGRKRSSGILGAEMLIFCGAVGFSVIRWSRGSDHQLIRNALWGRIFPCRHFAQALEMQDLFGAGGEILVLYLGLVAAGLTALLIFCFPRKEPGPLTDCSALIPWRFGILLLYVIPAVFCFVYSFRYEKQVLEKLSVRAGELLYLDPKEAHLRGLGRERRDMQFNPLLRSRNVAIAPGLQAFPRDEGYEITAKMPIIFSPAVLSPNAPRAVGIYFDGFALGKGGETQIRYRYRNLKTLQFTLPHNYADHGCYAFFPLPDGVIPESIRIFSSAVPGTGLKLRSYLQDGRRIPDHLFLY